MELLRAKRPECTLEAQDFRFDDTELIYTCYRTPYADVFGLNLQTKAITTYRKIAGEYNEVEGIFPDGQYTLVESSKDQSAQDSQPHRHLEAAAGAERHRVRAHDALGRLRRLQGVEPGGEPGRQDDSPSSRRGARIRPASATAFTCWTSNRSARQARVGRSPIHPRQAAVEPFRRGPEGSAAQRKRNRLP